MPATLTTVSSILKEVYEDDIRDQLQSDVVALRRIERSSEGVTNEVGGKYVTFPVKVRRNHGIGARNEMEALPTPGQQGYNAARVNLKYLYGGVRLSGQTLKLAEKNYQAFSSALDQEIEGLKTDLAKDLNRQVFGTGNGVLATVTADAANTVTVSNPQYLELGMQIDIYASDLTTLRAADRQITAIAGSVITYSGADASASIVATDVLTRMGSRNREINGFGSIIAASGALYNIDPATEPIWAARVDANGGTPRALSEGLMILQVDEVKKRGGKVSAIFTNLGVRRAYFNLLVQQRQIVNTQKFEGGFSGLAFTTDQGEVPVVVDTDCQPNRMWFTDEKELTVYRESDWSWMDLDGSMWDRVPGFDAWEATMACYMELGTHKRNSHALLTDLIES